MPSNTHKLGRISKTPWRIEERYLVIDREGNLVATLEIGRPRANASLILAAPDMREALRYMCSQCTKSCDVYGSTHCQDDCPVAYALRKADGIVCETDKPKALASKGVK